MNEPPVALFVPPEGDLHPAITPLPLPSLADPPPRSTLLIGIAAVDRSGRLREHDLVTALGWQSGDRFSVAVTSQMAVLTRDDTGRFHLDPRRQFFLPSPARARLGIDRGDRVVLVVEPGRDAVIIHPLWVVATLLGEFHQALRESDGP